MAKGVDFLPLSFPTSVPVYVDLLASLAFSPTRHICCCFIILIIIIESSRGSFAQPSYGIQAQHRSNLLIGQELVFEHEYAVGVRHMR